MSEATAPARERDIFGNEPPEGVPDWSHRRGEPRTLALLWMIYLMIASALMFGRLSTGLSISSSVSRPAVREMLVLVMVGISLLWPVLRLSQRVPRGNAVAAALRDWVVVLVPVQAVVWPNRLIVLGGWSMDVVTAIAAHSAAWALVNAAIIATGHSLIRTSTNPSLVRAVMTLVCVAALVGVPVIELLTLHGASVPVSHAHFAWMLSPITGVMEITRDRSVLGPSAVVWGVHFRIVLGVAIFGLSMLLFALMLERRSGLVRGGDRPYP